MLALIEMGAWQFCWVFFGRVLRRMMAKARVAILSEIVACLAEVLKDCGACEGDVLEIVAAAYNGGKPGSDRALRELKTKLDERPAYLKASGAVLCEEGPAGALDVVDVADRESAPGQPPSVPRGDGTPPTGGDR